MPDLPNDPTPNQPTISFGPVDRSETLGYRQDPVNPADASPNAFDAPTVPGYDIAGELAPRAGEGVRCRGAGTGRLAHGQLTHADSHLRDERSP